MDQFIIDSQTLEDNIANLTSYGANFDGIREAYNTAANEATSEETWGGADFAATATSFKSKFEELAKFMEEVAGFLAENQSTMQTALDEWLDVKKGAENKAANA